MIVSRTYPQASRLERFAVAASRWTPRWSIICVALAAYVGISLLQAQPFVYLFVFAPVLLFALELTYELVDKLEQSMPKGKQEVRVTAAHALRGLVPKAAFRSAGVHAGIDEEDIRHFQQFDPARRTRILQSIMARTPTHTTVLTGLNGFEKTVQQLHRDDFRLIDLHREDSAFTSMWYRKPRGLRNFGGGAAVMLIWEMGENAASTTITDWKI
jgi:hypothetical protein